MRVSIIAHVNSRRPRVEMDRLGTIHVYVNAPPLEGKANEAIIEALAVRFKTKKSSVVLTHGVKSKNKVFSVG